MNFDREERSHAIHMLLNYGTSQAENDLRQGLQMLTEMIGHSIIHDVRNFTYNGELYFKMI
jgi:hypothetical protein